MDFEPEYMQQYGHGQYIPMPVDLLPVLWLVYSSEASDSNKMHSPIREKWHEGDKDVRNHMHRIANCAAEGRYK